MTFRSVWLFIPFLLCSFATAQEHLVQTGPFNTPVMVADEFGIMRAAIVVYDTKGEAFVIPDITSAVWRAWHIAEFRKSGKYPIKFYIWYKTTKVCESLSPKNTPQACYDNLGFLAETALVNTRKQTSRLLNGVMVDRDGVSNLRTLTIQEEDSTPHGKLGIAIERITKIVESESKGGRGD